MLKLPASCEIVVALKVPPASTKCSLIDKLRREIVPVLNVMVGVPAKSGISTSSLAAGTTPPTQLLGTFQLPPATFPQVIVASKARSSNISTRNKRRISRRRDWLEPRLRARFKRDCNQGERFESGMIVLILQTVDQRTARQSRRLRSRTQFNKPNLHTSFTNLFLRQGTLGPTRFGDEAVRESID